MSQHCRKSHRSYRVDPPTKRRLLRSDLLLRGLILVFPAAAATGVFFLLRFPIVQVQSSLGAARGWGTIIAIEAITFSSYIIYLNSYISREIIAPISNIEHKLIDAQQRNLCATTILRGIRRKNI